MPHPVDRLDAAFVSAASISLALIRSREVADHWSEPSVLPRMSVGALSCHLGRQAVRAAEVLGVVTDVPPLDSADAHYHSAAWVRSTSPEDPANDRSTDDVDAALGFTALHHRSSEALDATREMLAAGDACDACWSRGRDGRCGATTSCSRVCWRSWCTATTSR